MSETIEEAGEATIRIPRNVYGLLRESYDARERLLDWLLVFAIVGILIFTFWDRLISWGTAPVLPDDRDTPESGRWRDMQPNQNVIGALPERQKARSNIYTYNMPPSRNIRHGTGPSGTRPPDDPALPPTFPVQQMED